MTTIEPPTAPVAPAAPPVSPVEWVRALPDADREAILMALLKEAIQIHGDVGRIDIETTRDDYIGYFVPAKAEQMEADRVLPKLSPERETELERRLREGKFVPIKELIGTPIDGAAVPQTP